MEKVKDKYFGRDEYMNPVVVESKIDIVGQIKKVLISDFSKQTIYGKISKEEKNIFRQLEALYECASRLSTGKSLFIGAEG